MAGDFLAEAGLPSGCQAAKDGGRRRKKALADAKAAHLGGFPRSCGPCRRRGPGQKRGPDRLFPGAARQKLGITRPKRGVWAAFRGGLGGRCGQKSPFLPQKSGQGGCAGGENWREDLAGREGLSGPLQVIFGRTGRKRLGLCKALSRTYRKKTVPAHFLCR